METILDAPSSSNSSNSDYAGFWLRFFAIIIDGLIFTFAIGAIAAWATLSQNINLVILTNIILIIGGWLYFAMMESSERQATFGKMALGLKVIGTNGERISFGKATGRHFGKIISGMIMYIGYIMAGFTEKKQGLHDIMAGTLVVKK